MTVNYRLGLFGWLRSDGLGTSGNEGLGDQRAALDWVAREISGFGGDPGNVTLLGESAGAISIAAHLAGGSAGGRPFRRAILQSGAHHLLLGRSAADRTCQRVLDHLGRPSPAELRKLTAADLLAAQDAATPRAAGIFYGALRDGDLVPADPLGALRSGAAAGVDLLIGSNRDEMGFFWGRDPDFDRVDGDRLRAIAAQWAPDQGAADTLVDAYRRARAGRGESTDERALALAIASDATFRRGALELADAQAAHATVHTYLFDWPSPLHDGLVGAAHLLETPFVFGTHHHPTVAAFTGARSARRRRAVRHDDGRVDRLRPRRPTRAGPPTTPSVGRRWCSASGATSSTIPSARSAGPGDWSRAVIPGVPATDRRDQAGTASGARWATRGMTSVAMSSIERRHGSGSSE